MVSFGERLREERERLHLTQAALAERLGQSRKSQVRYEAGERSPDAGYLSALAEIGIDVQYVLSGVHPRPDPLLLMICGGAVREEYAAAGCDLSPENHFNQAVWVYDQILDRVPDPADGDAIEAALPQVRDLLQKRLLKTDTGGSGTVADNEVTE